MYRVYFDGETKMGCYIQNACLLFNEEPTMTELVKELKENDYISFKLLSMSKLIKI